MPVILDCKLSSVCKLLGTQTIIKIITKALNTTFFNSRLLDKINNNQRIECNITQYPPMDSTIGIAQKAANGLPSSIIKDIIIPESIVISGTYC